MDDVNKILWSELDEEGKIKMAKRNIAIAFALDDIKGLMKWTNVYKRLLDHSNLPVIK